MTLLEKFLGSLSQESEKKKELEYFENLELAPGADFEMIELAYKHLTSQYNPLKFKNNPDKKASAEEVIYKLNEAYSYFQKKYAVSERC